jgi:tetratricopeptide (TPR) repeat protein
MYQWALAGSEQAYGLNHPDTYNTYNNLGNLVGDQGRHDEALQFYEPGLEGRKNALGELHADTLTARGNLAIMMYYTGNHDGAAEQYSQVAEGREKTLGAKTHPLVLTTLHNQAVNLLALGDVDKAAPLLEYVHRERAKVNADSIETSIAAHNLGVVYARQGLFAEAQTLFAAALQTRTRLLGADHEDSQNSAFNLDVTSKLVETQ